MAETHPYTPVLDKADWNKLNNNLPPHLTPEEFMGYFADKEYVTPAELTDLGLSNDQIERLEQCGALTREADVAEYYDFIQKAQARYHQAMGDHAQTKEIDTSIENKLQELRSQGQKHVYRLAIKPVK